MKKLFTKHLLILFFVFFSSSIVFGQGTIQGYITDSLTTQPLIGANVIILGTSLGRAANIEGHYRIMGIPAGSYNVKVSYIGYKFKIVNVTVQDNKTLQLDIALSTAVIEGKTVIVTGQAQGQVAAINQQLSSNTIVNVVSEQKIQELPDANAAQTIGRLPGVSVTRSGGEATQIVLRGLNARYTNVTIDGVRIPSTDALDRGIDLSMISQSSLAGIEVYKALLSDQDGDAIAGSVNLVTKKAPEQREIRAILKGGYNNLMKSAKQYDFSLKYGERFFRNLLGVQVSGNIENKIRSAESSNISYDQAIQNQTSYYIDNFTLNFTDEIRKRDGLNLILDFNTPDEGNIKLSGSFYQTKRNYITHSRDYPNGGGNTQYLGGVTYSFRDRNQTIKTYSSALEGKNILLGFATVWGLSFAQSSANYPYDYQLDFSEASDKGNAGMRDAPQIKDHPEQLVSYAYNNFLAASLAGAYNSTQDNFDKDQSVFLNLSKVYTVGKLFSGELKFGGKYKSKSRYNNQTQNSAYYYLLLWQRYQKLPNGTIQEKNFDGSYFQDFFQSNAKNISFNEFLNTPPESRLVEGIYNLYPLIIRDRLRQWYDLNKYGVDKTGRTYEYNNDPTFQAYYYDITEAVSAGYVMNTFKFGQNITFIAGIRVEQENNHYKNTYSKIMASGFPYISLPISDTTSKYTQTAVLPNFQFSIKPTDFLNVRLAAYKALARPDFNMRLNTYFAWRPAAVGGVRRLIVGNPELKTAEAWNFEVNTSFFGNKIGLFTISAFYKEIKNMYHMLNQINTSGNVIFDELGLATRTIHDGTYQLTVPYNSQSPTKVWGFELEHQINFAYLPGLLKNIVLSYNLSIVRSLTFLIGSKTDTIYTEIGGIPFPSYPTHAYIYKQELEDQPRFFGNISLGYDIAGFSGRISLFHQSEYYSSFSPSQRSDRIISGYNRIDLALKQKITDNVSLLLDVNNLTNHKDVNILYNRVNQYRLPSSTQNYGITADFGVMVSL